MIAVHRWMDDRRITVAGVELEVPSQAQLMITARYGDANGCGSEHSHRLRIFLQIFTALQTSSVGFTSEPTQLDGSLDEDYI
ncbi:hypothetical protein [Chamaesiphon sp.]|uniref:hypothetical protein n=1 Tax=Chamaesiphon sp. TaxID=2814140 RepID=UPI00359363E6